MIPPHSDVRGDAAAYVLGSLDPDDRAVFEAHLAGCDECAGHVRAFQRVAVALARGVPQRTPSPDLRERVRESVVGASTRSMPFRGAPGSAQRWLPIAATVIVALGVGLYAARLQIRVADLEVRLQQALVHASAADLLVAEARRVSASLQASMGVLAAPDLVRIDLAGQALAPQASARALWSRARGMVFTASSLPPLPEGRVYQVWVVTAQAPLSAGLLSLDEGGSGQAFFNTPPDIPPPAAVAVSIEPAGGVPSPTGPIYLVGKPS